MRKPIDQGASRVPLVSRPPDDPANPGEPPVIARVMVEIRSDGSRTIARGAMEDLLSGERVAIEARGSSLLNVALQLAGSMRSLPNLIRSRSTGDLELAPGTEPVRPRKRDQIRQRATRLLSKFK